MEEDCVEDACWVAGCVSGFLFLFLYNSVGAVLLRVEGVGSRRPRDLTHL